MAVPLHEEPPSGISQDQGGGSDRAHRLYRDGTNLRQVGTNVGDDFGVAVAAARRQDSGSLVVAVGAERLSAGDNNETSYVAIFVEEEQIE